MPKTFRNIGPMQVSKSSYFIFWCVRLLDQSCKEAFQMGWQDLFWVKSTFHACLWLRHRLCALLYAFPFHFKIIQLNFLYLQTARTWYFDAINLWVLCFLIRIIRTIFQFFKGKKISCYVRYFAFRVCIISKLVCYVSVIQLDYELLLKLKFIANLYYEYPNGLIMPIKVSIQNEKLCSSKWGFL
jgi:hypothetical protein